MLHAFISSFHRAISRRFYTIICPDRHISLVLYHLRPPASGSQFETAALSYGASSAPKKRRLLYHLTSSGSNTNIKLAASDHGWMEIDAEWPIFKVYTISCKLQCNPPLSIQARQDATPLQDSAADGHSMLTRTRPLLALVHATILVTVAVSWRKGLDSKDLRQIYPYFS